MQQDGGGEEPEPLPALPGGRPDEDGEGHLQGNRGEPLPEAEEVGACAGGLELFEGGRHLILCFCGHRGKQGVRLPEVDHDGHREGGNHRQAEYNRHFHAAVAEAVGDARLGLRGFLLEEELHGQEPASFLEETGHQAAVEGVVQGFSLDGRPARALENDLVYNRLQHQREDDEGAGADEDRGQLGLVLFYRPPDKENGDSEAQEGIYRHYDEICSRDHGCYLSASGSL